jgi:hypothetical protein
MIQKTEGIRGHFMIRDLNHSGIVIQQVDLGTPECDATIVQILREVAIDFNNPQEVRFISWIM